jgi:hypothetical protein
LPKFQIDSFIIILPSKLTIFSFVTCVSFDIVWFMLAPNTMSMSMSASKLTVFHLMLQIWKIRITKKIFVYFSMNDLMLNDVTLI